ncbi:MAG: alpha/beta hydrolase [Pyrinomonadaceae bacterium]
MIFENIKVLSLESKTLKGNPPGDSFFRDVIVYLPPEYKDEDRRFPVVYALSGFTGRGHSMLNDNAFSLNMPTRLNSLIATKTIEPMIVVMPDCFTYYGGSQYINSSATGDYEDYFTEEVVPFVDNSLRTIPKRNSRAVVGKSSGGYGALIMAMRHADQFGLACSIAGDCYFELCYRTDFVKAFRGINGDPKALIEKFWDETEPKSKYDFDGLNLLGMSACYSPNPQTELGFDLPFDLRTCEIYEDVWQRWLTNDPVNMVSTHKEALRSLQLLFLDAGEHDEFALNLGARILAQKLELYDVPYIHEEFNGGHFNINHRYDRSLALISEKIVTA